MTAQMIRMPEKCCLRGPAFHVGYIIVRWVPLSRGWVLRQGLGNSLFIWGGDRTEQEQRTVRVRPGRREHQSQGTLSSWSLLWASGVRSCRSSKEPCGCTSGLSVWRTEDKLTNSHSPLVRGHATGGWLSLLSSSTHTAYAMMGSPYCRH